MNIILKIGIIAIPILLSILVNQPGLTGDFHFDDLPNLSPLGAYGGIHSWENYRAYLSSAVASELGRPISLTSFLIDAQSWPAEPYPFLRTNIIIHGVNGTLLATCIYFLQSGIANQRAQVNAYLISILSASLWVSHPYLTSTTLYVVQRMAMLSSLFSLSAIALYLWARLNIHRSTPEKQRPYLIILFIGFPLLTLLSVLSKENGALTPLLALAIEYFAVQPLWGRSEQLTSETKSVFIILLIIPSLLVILLLLQRIPLFSMSETIPGRDLTYAERLLSQPAVLMHYIKCIFIPQSAYPGLFYDGHPLRSGKITDTTTLISSAGLFFITTLSFYLKRRWPHFGLASIFFLIGHSIESLTLGLEPIFEHRNYLPSVFIPFAIFSVLIQIKNKKIKNTILFLVGSTLFFLSHTHATLWGKPTELNLYWAQRNPWSTRAQLAAADRLLRDGQYTIALSILNAARLNIPNSAPILYTLMLTERKLGLINTKIEKEILAALEIGAFNKHLPKISDSILANYLGNNKTLASKEFVTKALDTLISRKDYQDRTYQIPLRLNRLKLSLSHNEPDTICQDSLYLLREAKSIDAPIRIAAELGNSHYFDDAFELLSLAEQRLHTNRESDLRFPASWYQKEIARLHATITEDIKNPEIKHETIDCDFAGKK